MRTTMITIRRSEERGKANHGWLKSYHSFSFADYYDPAQIGFHGLRVINEDYIEAGKGFGAHPHSNMEIISYVVNGEIAHKDSMGNVKIVKTGEFQAMSAGTGVTHSEFNPSEISPLHLLQIWIVPNKKNIEPSYSEWKPKVEPKTETEQKDLTLIASSDGLDGSIKIQADASLYLGTYETGKETQYEITSGRHVWLQLVKGELLVNNQRIFPGDGVAVSEEKNISIKTLDKSIFLLFDLVGN